MTPYKHLAANRELAPPEDWDQSKMACDSLWVISHEEQGMPCVMSVWKPTPEELAALNDGGSVFVNVIGATMPPMIVGVTPDETK